MYCTAPGEAGFLHRQIAFANHIRNPEQQPGPGDVEKRRMAIYRELFFNNLEGFLTDSFPVLRSILPQAHWQTMTRDFFAHHACCTPLFTRLAEEFIDYLEHERKPVAEDPPFLLELAHYEWVEMALTLSDADAKLPPVDAQGDLLNGHPVISPLVWRLSYAYPVHRIGPDFVPKAPTETPNHLVVYRNRQDQVGFLQINPVSHALLEVLDTSPSITGAAALDMILNALNHPAPNQVRLAGIELLEDLRQRDILLGIAL